MVDVRGRYESEGRFDPYRQEGRDGYRNLHTGELETVGSTWRQATITIHHGPKTPSQLVLPVVP